MYKQITFFIILLLIIIGSNDKFRKRLRPRETRAIYENGKIYDLDKAQNIKIYNKNGDVKLTNQKVMMTGSFFNMIEVTQIKKLINDELIYRNSEFEKSTVETKFDGDTFLIQTKFYENFPNAKIDLELTIRNSEVKVDEIQTTNGNIIISNINNDFKAATDSGEIQINDNKSFVELFNENGNISVINTNGIKKINVGKGTINAEIQNVTNETTIINNNGDINIKISCNLNTNIEIEATDQNIINNTTFLKLLKNDKVFKGTIGAGTNLLFIKASNGQIKILDL